MTETFDPSSDDPTSADAHSADQTFETDTPDETPTPPRRHWGRWIAAALLVLAAVAGGTVFLAGNDANGAEAETSATAEDAENGDDDATTDGEEADEPVPVELATVETGEVSSYITATTNLVAEGEVMVLAEVEGRVERVTVDEGASVSKGQILANLNRKDAEIALEKARVKEANAETVYQRGRELSKDELISAEDLDERRLSFELARQEREEAEWRLAKTEIRAAISGRVSSREIQTGQHVRPGDALFQITDFDPLLARIYLPERDVLQLSAGRPVTLSLDAAPEVRFDGRIRQIAPVVDPATGTVKVTLEVRKAPHQVRPGSFVTARVVRERRPGVVLVPKDAVLRELQQSYVFVAAAEGETLSAVKRPVTLGLEEDGRVQALSGVEPGERLVVAGQGSLSDGDAIRTLDDAAGAATAGTTAASREG